MAADFLGGTGIDQSLSVENEQAGARRDGRTRLVRPNSQARTGTGKYSFLTFPVQPSTTSRIGNHTWLIHALLIPLRY